MTQRGNSTRSNGWRSATRQRVMVVTWVAASTLAGCGSSDDGLDKINGAVHVAAGAAPASANTVNGNIELDANAAVTEAHTVNGRIHLAEHATAGSLATVNGGIVLAPGAHVEGNATAVNGAFTLGDGADVQGNVTNTNGAIELQDAHVGGVIKTVNGPVTVRGGSRVDGGIVVEKSSGLSFGNDPPRIEIGPGSTVSGPLRFERPVKLYVSDKASIGAVTGAAAIPFSGDAAPSG